MYLGHHQVASKLLASLGLWLLLDKQGHGPVDCDTGSHELSTQKGFPALGASFCSMSGLSAASESEPIAFTSKKLWVGAFVLPHGTVRGRR